MNEPPTIEEMAPTHQCWWRGMAEGLSAVLETLDQESAADALRSLLRREIDRRKAAEQAANVWAYRAQQAGWTG